MFHHGGAFLVRRTKRGVPFRRRYSRPVDTATGLRSDHAVVLAAAASRKRYPDPFRVIRFHESEQNRSLRFLSNKFDRPALTACLLYNSRWQVELFLQMDQAAPAHQVPCPSTCGGHHEEATGAGGQPSRNPTGAQPHTQQVPILQNFGDLGDLEPREKSGAICNQLTLLDL